MNLSTLQITLAAKEIIKLRPGKIEGLGSVLKTKDKFYVSVIKPIFAEVEKLIQSNPENAALALDSSIIVFEINSAESKNHFKRLNNAGFPGIVLVHVPESSLETFAISFFESNNYRLHKQIGNLHIFEKANTWLNVHFNTAPVKDESVQQFLTFGWRKLEHLPLETQTWMGTINPLELLVPKRFDIAIKLLFVRLFWFELATKWRNYAYKELALRITGPGSEIIEHGTTKKGGEEFIATFESLIKSFNASKIPPVPVDQNMVAFDGSHRIAAGIFNRSPIRCARVNTANSINANYLFFKNSRNGHLPLDSSILDEAAIEYSSYRRSARLAIIYPVVTNQDFAHNMLEEFAEIAYKKQIKMNPRQGRELLRQIYHGNYWFSKGREEKGLESKQKSSFPYAGTMTAILIDNFLFSDLREIKEQIRAHYSLANHSIHITDSYDETVRLSKVVFNKGSIQILDRGTKPSTAFLNNLYQYRDWIDSTGIEPSLFCIDGSSLLSLGGIREANDTDFLFHGAETDLQKLPEGIELHNNQAKYHSKPVSSIIGDPKNHFWYMGVKFISPELLLEMKKNRNERKDIQDIIWLKSMLPSSNAVENVGLRIKQSSTYFMFLRIYYNRRLRRTIKRILRTVTNGHFFNE
jgi:hypothetical protein